MRSSKLLQRYPDKIDGRITGIAGFMFFANVDGLHPAHVTRFSDRYRRGLHAAAAPRPGAALDVDEDLVARMRMEALPLAGFDLHPLYDEVVSTAAVYAVVR